MSATSNGTVEYDQSGCKFPPLALNIRTDYSRQLDTFLEVVPSTGTHNEATSPGSPTIYTRAPNSLMTDRFTHQRTNHRDAPGNSLGEREEERRLGAARCRGLRNGAPRVAKVTRGVARM
jgi:hypothetical protein